MEATALVFFADVVDAGSFAAASRRMGLDRSNVSRRINEMEQQLGSQLLRRTTRSMELTEAGAFFYERCCMVRAEVDYAQKAMWDLSGSVRGRVTVSCPPMLAQEIIAPLLVDFCRQYPLVDLKLILKNHVSDLLTGKVDISLKLTDSPEPATVARRLASVRWLICASPAYLADKAEPASPADLARLDWVDQWKREFLELDGGHGIERVRIHMRLESIDLTLLRRTLVDGLGVGVLPDYAAQPALEAGRLKQLMADYTVLGAPGTTLFAMTPPTRYMPSKVKVLLDFLAKAFEANDGRVANVAAWRAA